MIPTNAQHNKMLLLPMDKNGKKEDAGGIIPKAPNKFNKIFNKII